MLGMASQGASRILLVEDDPSRSSALRYSLEAAGYQVQVATTAKQAVLSWSEFKPDLLLLDAVLPDTSGFEVCRQLRAGKAHPQPAIIIVSTQAQESDRVTAFEVGADDFVAKPFGLSELLLRIQLRLQARDPGGRATGEGARRGEPHFDRLTVGPLEIDRTSHRVFLSGQEINLSVQEMRLLNFLAAEPGRMHTRKELLTVVWGYHPDATSRTLDTHIKRLRDKFGPLASMIQTVHGIGYRMTLPLNRPEGPNRSKPLQRRR